VIRRLSYFVAAGTLAGFAALGASALAMPRLVDAAPAPAAAESRLAETSRGGLQQSTDNSFCLGCHGNPELSLELDNGDVLSLYVEESDHARSVHGQVGIACVQCHTGIDGFPHPDFRAADRRDASLQLYTACQTCHADQYARANDSVHGRALEAGNREAAICTDCHTAHTVRRLTNPATRQLLPDARIWVPQTCAQCHSAIYDKYSDSVHGAALIEEDNLDVPTCIDCHGVHDIGDPTTAAFRLQSPSICAKCHTDSSIMDKYGISTQVLNTYVSDFHGTTVTLFEKQTPDAETNKPVCFDCHGVHDIKPVDDPEKGLHVRENLLLRCQVCHPTATANFSEAWLSHYIPSQEKTPLVYFVNLFYQIFIPGVLGSMAVLVALDAGSKVRHRFLKRGRRAQTEASPEVKPAQVESSIPAAETAGAVDSVPDAIADKTEASQPGDTPGESSDATDAERESADG
jgi:nitrate/TMAO reductase-like tetraheme cytochrome c subunit